MNRVAWVLLTVSLSFASAAKRHTCSEEVKSLAAGHGISSRGAETITEISRELGVRPQDVLAYAAQLNQRRPQLSETECLQYVEMGMSGNLSINDLLYQITPARERLQDHSEKDTQRSGSAKPHKWTLADFWFFEIRDVNESRNKR